MEKEKTIKQMFEENGFKYDGWDENGILYVRYNAEKIKIDEINEETTMDEIEHIISRLLAKRRSKNLL